MNTKVILLIFSIILSLFCSCGSTKPNCENNGNNIMEDASLLRIYEFDGYDRVEIINPNDSSTIDCIYYLVKKQDCSNELPNDGVIIEVPVSNMLVYTSVYASALKELGSIDVVKGVVDADYFKIPEIKDGLKSGKIVNAGKSDSPIAEKILELEPDCILLTSYEGMSSADIDKYGIPILKFTDQMETSPLGRSEWIKFLGRLTGNDQKADSIFSVAKSNYLNLKHKVSKSSKRPTVLTENMYQGVWYVPGGKSYQAALIEDAGGDYIWKDNNSPGSLSLSYEEVLDKAQNADIWLLKVYGEQLSKSSLLKKDPRYVYFSAVNEGGVYFSDTESGNLFEEFPFHPDLLLADYAAIFQPELFDKYKFRYFKPMPL